MGKYFTLAMATLGLGGCGAFEVTGEAITKPPMEILEAIKAIFYWVGSWATVFMQGLFDQIF